MLERTIVIICRLCQVLAQAAETINQGPNSTYNRSILAGAATAWPQLEEVKRSPININL